MYTVVYSTLYYCFI